MAAPAYYGQWVGQQVLDPETGLYWVYSGNPSQGQNGWVLSNAAPTSATGTISGPGGITLGSYNPQTLTQEQRNWLWNAFGNSGTAPIGYGGQSTTASTAGTNLQTALAQTPTAPATNQPINLEDFKVEALNTYIKQVMSDPNFQSYYTRLLDKAEGDVTVAKQRLEEDYQTGVRLTTKQLQQKTEATQGDLDATIKALTGGTFPKEQEQLQDTLNKRGIAVTQNTPYNTKDLGYAGGGRSGYELSQLTEDQKLRREAVERNASNTFKEIGLQKSELLGDSSQGIKGKYLTERERGMQDTESKAKDYKEELEQQRQQKAYSIASLKQQADIANKQMQFQAEIAGKTEGGAKGVTAPVIPS